jgi:hypothetical protein
MSVRRPQSIQPPPLSGREFPTINSVFDALELIAERTEKLVWKAKFLLFGTGFLLFLIYELALFGRHLLKMWNHS